MIPTSLRSLLLLLALCMAGTAGASALVDRVNRQLQHPPVLRGQFEQQRLLAGFSKPMKSRGRFVVASQRGALWLTEFPFSSQLILTRDALVQKSGSTTRQKLDATREPALRAINSVLFALLAGDISALEQRFVIDGRADAKSWSLSLSPRDASWKQVMTRIDLAGSAYVESLEMLDANQDRTVIRFVQTEAGSTLNDDEASRFE